MSGSVELALFPVFLKLRGRVCVVVGAGRVAEPKIAALLSAGAIVRVVAPRATATIGDWAREEKLSWIQRVFVAPDVEGAELVIAATNSAIANREIFEAARARGVWCNAVDDPQHCDFYSGAVVRRGPLQIAVSTAGRSPALAQRLRRQFEQQFGPEYGSWIEKLGRERERLMSRNVPVERRRAILHRLAAAEPFDRTAKERDAKRAGKVYLVGAGPGDPELLTLKAMRVLREADAVLHDDLVDERILRLIPGTTELRNVGKRCGPKKVTQQEINFLLVTQASAGMQVVRLKSGDPLLFGRGGEEIAALRGAGIEYEIVPGVTSAMGAAAAAEIPLTHRAMSSGVVFLTAHHADAESEWKRHVRSGATLVIYMPGDYGRLAQRLLKLGVDPAMPCAVVSRATQAGEAAFRTTVGRLHQQRALPAPAVVIVGGVVRLGRAEIIDFFAASQQQNSSIGVRVAVDTIRDNR